MRAQGWVKSGSGEKAEARAALLGLGGAGDTVWQGEQDRVQPWGYVWVLQRRNGPGGVSASGELPGALPREERCSGTPDPRGKPTCTERPGQRSRETARAGRVPAKGFRAHRTADGGCRGSKVNLLRPELATRSLGSRLALRSTNMHRQRRGFPAGPASLAL